ncbi:MAG: cation transporter [Paludibacteraceae bacterium]|nr:cation transporter [Paludibacteraceae bacterium]
MRIKLIIVSVVLMSAMTLSAKEKKRETAVFHVEISCDNCVKRIQDNIAFEKGLKDMRIDKEQQTVTLTWDPEKTDTLQLKTAFQKIRKPVSKIEKVSDEKKQ